jgi:oligopeptide transport system substrate-binding protein
VQTHTGYHNTILAVIGIAAILIGSILPDASVLGRQQPEPVTLYRADILQVYTLDPQLASAPPSITAVENLFLGLTTVDPITNQVVPELATQWTISDDGRVWTFMLRPDVPWVYWNPVTQTGEVLRPVTAYDAEYAIKRVCDPRLEASYTYVVSDIIQGCKTLATMPPHQVTDADYDLVQVRALDDTTLEIHLEFAAGYFLSMTPMWIFHPVPREIIEEFGETWTEPGILVTNGPFVLDRWIPGSEHVLVRNRLLPADLQGPGNIERVITTRLDTYVDTFALYQDNLSDWTGVPSAEKQAVLEDAQYADQRLVQYNYFVHYFGFAYDKPPFDNVHARRAFAAAFDRQRFVDEIIGPSSLGPAVPMIHLTAPGMFGAPPVGEVGMGYDPDYAREQLALAGYPNCTDLPPIQIVIWEQAGSWGEFLAKTITETLGCDPQLLRLEAVSDSILLALIDPTLPAEQRPNMWTLFWGPDYPDANSFIGDVLGCESFNDFNRPCTEIDDLIDQAAAESDVATRAALYHEKRFFGREGEFPIIPLFMGGSLALHKPWYTGPFLTENFVGSPHYDWYTIDQAAQLAARGE